MFLEETQAFGSVRPGENQFAISLTLFLKLFSPCISQLKSEVSFLGRSHCFCSALGAFACQGFSPAPAQLLSKFFSWSWRPRAGPTSHGPLCCHGRDRWTLLTG